MNNAGPCFIRMYLTKRISLIDIGMIASGVEGSKCMWKRRQKGISPLSQSLCQLIVKVINQGMCHLKPLYPRSRRNKGKNKHISSREYWILRRNYCVKCTYTEYSVFIKWNRKLTFWSVKCLPKQRAIRKGGKEALSHFFLFLPQNFSFYICTYDCLWLAFHTPGSLQISSTNNCHICTSWW